MVVEAELTAELRQKRCMSNDNEIDVTAVMVVVEEDESSFFSSF